MTKTINWSLNSGKITKKIGKFSSKTSFSSKCFHGHVESNCDQLLEIFHKTESFAQNPKKTLTNKNIFLKTPKIVVLKTCLNFPEVRKILAHCPKTAENFFSQERYYIKTFVWTRRLQFLELPWKLFNKWSFLSLNVPKRWENNFPK